MALKKVIGHHLLALLRLLDGPLAWKKQASLDADIHGFVSLLSNYISGSFLTFYIISSMGHRSRIQVLHTDQIVRRTLLCTKTLLEFELYVHLLKLQLIQIGRLPVLLQPRPTIFALYLLNRLLRLSDDSNMPVLADLSDPALEPRYEFLASLRANI
jgi:hypothetical protein